MKFSIKFYREVTVLMHNESKFNGEIYNQLKEEIAGSPIGL